MGYGSVRGIVANSLNRHLRLNWKFIVDRVSIRSVIPKSRPERLQLEEINRRISKSTKGEAAEYPVSEEHVSVERESAKSHVTIATGKTPTLLGETTPKLLDSNFDLAIGKLTP
jgi:predicted aspartyl protease